MKNKMALSSSSFCLLLLLLLLLIHHHHRHLSLSLSLSLSRFEAMASVGGIESIAGTTNSLQLQDLALFAVTEHNLNQVAPSSSSSASVK